MPKRPRSLDCRRNSPGPARIPPPPPSPLFGHRQAAQAGTSRGSGPLAHRGTTWAPQALTGSFPPRSRQRGCFDHHIDLCPHCGQNLTPLLTTAPRVIQRVDIQAMPLTIEEHRGHPAWCPDCRKLYEAPLPLRIARGGLAGPHLMTLIASPKGICHASFSTIHKFPSRCRPGDHLARGVGPAHRQSESRAGAAPMRNC
jgi:hypothetical protein